MYLSVIYDRIKHFFINYFFYYSFDELINI
jgi:hypothetical protein